MLVANNFHFENNCAILSADGYPQGRSETVLAMLRRNPQLQVFTVHDASIPGCALPLTLRQERWFPDPGVSVLDLGLRPRHALALNLFTLGAGATVVPPALRDLLAAREVAWLEAGNLAEVAALRPARLMRAIYQGFAAQRTGDGGGSGDGAGGIWFYSSGADVYAADTFG